MAPVLSRTLATTSLVSLPTSTPFSFKHSNNKAFNFRSAFLPRSGGLTCAGLKWNLQKRNKRVGIRCDAAVADKEAPDTSGEKFEYQAEVSRLLDLIVHSLYSHKEVFLRELVSNASDALDKLRFLSVTEPSLLGDAGDLEIRIKPDPENGTITITDTGIGMTKEELVDCLGTIAQSGTSKFLKALKENKDLGPDNGLIGQFGVGFYSAFLVAQKVVVATKSPRSDKQYVWEAEADSSSYVIGEETDPEKLLKRGTQITLYLKEDDKYEFSEPTRIQGLVKNYSQFVSFPIYTWQEKSRTIEVEEEEKPEEGEEQPEGEKKTKKTTKTEKYWDWELANETKPIWMRNPKEIEKDEYHEFYKKTFNEFLDPLAYTHFTTEGEVEFRSVLYIPGMGPLNNEEIMNPKTKNIRLYVKRVFISDDFDGELFPRYLSFVKGVVDSDDLPLNVSREILQESRIVRIMRKRLVRKTFDMIQDISQSENKEDYKKLWENFGRFLKLGCVEDSGNHKRLAPLLRFYTSKNEEELTSLDEYVENMGEKQNAIYYLATDSLKSAKSAPFLEKLVQKDIEVLYLIEPIDEVAIQNLQTYKEKKFVDISKEDLELGDEDEVKERETKQEFNLLCDWIKQQLGDKVAKVQVSKRLSSSPCVLVSGKFGWSANMERLMKAQALGDTSSLEFMRGRRILEINPDHPIVKDLNAACKNAPDSTDAKRAVDLLYDTALISSGFTPDSPAELGNKIYEMASMHVKRRQNGKWFIYSFVKEHNHELLPAQVHFFRSHRNVDPLKNDVRIRRRKNLAAVSKLFNAYQNVDCLETYMRNQHDKGRSLVLDPADSQVLLEYFMQMQEENPKFFYAFDLNEEHRLRNVFWVDAKGMEDYTNFGDVVSFDSTYFTNKYKISLVLFVGVNHHIQPTLLGCALIADETVYTFVWLLQTWFLAMGERAPQVILTDQNSAIKAAVAAVFPETRHCFSLWNVLEMIPRHLEYLSPWHDNFMEKFYKCIYRSWTEEQFEKRWWKLVEKFHLREVQWIQLLYEDRKHWVPTFMRGISFAALSTPSRSESLNSLFDKYVRGETSLREFIEQYRVILEDRYEEEAKADFDAWHETPELKSPSPFEKQMSLVYTHEIFKKFQVEVLGAAACHLKKENEFETTTTYEVKDFEDNQNFMVEWNESKLDIYCSCRSFEYKGYLCRHAIIVLQMSGVFSIPSKYILQRWTNAAKSRHVISERLDEMQSKVRRYNDLCRRAIILGEEGSISQESYSMALSAIQEALKQCASLNISVESNARPITSDVLSVCATEEENQFGNTSKDKVPYPLVVNTNGNSSRADTGRGKGSNVSNTAKKGKQATQQLTWNVRTQDGCHQMELSDMRPTQLHNFVQTPLQVLPTMFHNVAPTQFHNVPTTHLQDSRLPR